MDSHLTKDFILESNEMVFSDRKTLTRYLAKLIRRANRYTCAKQKKNIVWKTLRSIWQNRWLMTDLRSSKLVDAIHVMVRAFAYEYEWHVANVFREALFPWINDFFGRFIDLSVHVDYRRRFFSSRSKMTSYGKFPLIWKFGKNPDHTAHFCKISIFDDKKNPVYRFSEIKNFC